MSTEEYAAYRGCSVEVHVTEAKSRTIHGMYRRYRVSWTVALKDSPDRKITNLPEQFDFLSERHAFKYGEGLAHTYIDSILSTPSKAKSE